MNLVAVQLIQPSGKLGSCIRRVDHCRRYGQRTSGSWLPLLTVVAMTVPEDPESPLTSRGYASTAVITASPPASVARFPFSNTSPATTAPNTKMPEAHRNAVV